MIKVTRQKINREFDRYVKVYSEGVFTTTAAKCDVIRQSVVCRNLRIVTWLCYSSNLEPNHTQFQI